MSMSNAAEAAFLDLLFLNIDWADVGDAAGLQNSATPGNFYVALHSADPGEAGTQSTNEVSYTGYARVAIPRTGSGFSRSGDTISNVAAITFGQCTAGSASATYGSIGLASSGAGVILWSGPLSTTLPIVPPIQPVIAAGTFTIQVD
jgi:hypothetical protein